MKVVNGLLLFFTAFFMNACKCDSYYSNSGEESLREGYFAIECHIVPTMAQNESDKIEVTVNYKQVPSQRVIRPTLKIFPIVYETGDTLELLSEYASVYTFNSKGTLEARLNLTLNFILDSAGVDVRKIIVFPRLEKIKKCRFRPILH